MVIRVGEVTALCKILLGIDSKDWFRLVMLVLFLLGPLTSVGDASQSRVKQSPRGH